MRGCEILHIAECGGGVDRYLSMLLPLLAGRHAQVLVCSQKLDAEKYRGMVERVRQIDMRRTLSPLRVAKEVVRLRRVIRAERPAAVYCHSSIAGALGRLACIGSGRKVVYNPHGWAFNMRDGSRTGRRLYLAAERMLARWTDRIVCISGAEYRSAVDRRVCGEEKLRVIENGVDVRAIECAAPVGRAALGFGEEDYVIGMVGRLVRQKAPDVFIRAGRLIRERIGNAVFVIVGDGEEREEVQAYARRHGLKLCVTGWVDDPYPYVKTFDVAMLLSRWEGFGLSIPEYMSAKKPVVAARVDAIPTLIEDGVDGLLADADSPEDACAKVMFIHTHHEETEEMKERAYRKALRRFDIRRVAAQHIELFAELGGVVSRLILPIAAPAPGRERRRAA